MKITKRTVSFKGKFLKVISKEILVNNKKYLWECVRKKEAVFIFALTPKKELILEKLYRYPLEGYEITLPAGTMDKKEGYPECAKRELQEETGYQAKKFISVFKFPLDPGVLENFGHIFFAKDAEYNGGENREDLEFIEVIKIPLNELSNFLFNPPKGCVVDLRVFGAWKVIKEKKLI
jgi:ADP-ribose pyrophosphatase